MKNAAIALSSAHDSHNIVMVSDNERDSILALEKLQELTGGIVLVSNGEVIDALQLEVGGIMTDSSAFSVKERLENMEHHAGRLGVNDDIDDPFLSLAFLSLPVIPDLKLTDKGLFDVRNFKLISLEAGE